MYTVTGEYASYKITVNMLALAAHRASCGECARTGDGGVVMTGSDPAKLGRLPNRWSALFASASSRSLCSYSPVLLGQLTLFSSLSLSIFNCTLQGVQKLTNPPKTCLRIVSNFPHCDWNDMSADIIFRPSPRPFHMILDRTHVEMSVVRMRIPPPAVWQRESMKGKHFPSGLPRVSGT